MCTVCMDSKKETQNILDTKTIVISPQSLALS